MEKFILIVLYLILTILMTGCSNAITYYHAERASIALEAKTTDPQQPLQGNVGIKTRTVIVAPGKKRSNNPPLNDLGESTSVISDFRLERQESGVFGKTDINSAFITGDAAVAAPPDSANAISGLGFGPLSDASVGNFQLMQQIYDNLKTIKETDAEAARHILLLDELGKLLPTDISTRTYYKKDGNDIKERAPVTIPQSFQGILDYEGILRGTLAAIEQMENDRKITYNNSSIDKAVMETFLSEKKRLQKERDHFFTIIGNSNIIDSAAAYAVSRL